jgi:uncharacterized protein YyaL (SSP411 family)
MVVMQNIDVIFQRFMTRISLLLGSLLALSWVSCGPRKENSPMHSHTNELITETSPYLLQHAHNPVDWHAWNVENLNEAKKLGKPLLISIGYSSCHWCHVMEHESFVNEKIAEYMNEHFYCIKVDREERPDVDAIYMTAANIITGSGGWPLNCFALPSGKPFHAGTYYPPAGWLKLLQTVSDQYSNNREKLETYANKLTQGIRLQETAISDNPSESLDKTIPVKAVEGWKNNWDTEEGGMAKAPKFPMPSNYEFLLNYNKHINDPYTEAFLKTTLNKMAYGGILDQIGGGFSRYSVDELWKAPHFEKMLYDNAQLLNLYAKAYQRYENDEYITVINKTIDWLQRDMLNESGLFYAALDADSEGEEGKYYVWKSEELKTILGNDYPLAAVYYEVDGKGLWEHGNNILLREHSDEYIAQKFGITNDELRNKIEKINAKLLEQRAKRVAPGLDDKCLTAWNAMLVSGLLESYKITQNKNHKKLAINCLNTLINKQLKPNGMWHTYKEGTSTIEGMLDSYAFMIQACLDGFYISGDGQYYTTAELLLSQAIEKFYDADKGLFYFNQENELIIRTSEVYDNVIPATNSVMVNNLAQLGLLQGNNTYLQMAEEMIGKVQANIAQYPSGHSNWATAHLVFSQPFYEIIVVGEDAETLANSLQGKDLTNCIIAYSQKYSSLPMFANRYKNGETNIYVCQRGACKLPIKTVNETLQLVDQ